MNTNAGLAPLRVSENGSSQGLQRAHERHRDRYVHYSHQMNGDTAESSARTLIRVVPLVYGALLGGLIGSVALGLSFGLIMSLAFDLRMGDKSILRPMLKPVSRIASPPLSSLRQGLVVVCERARLPVPAYLRGQRCDSR